MVDIESIIEAAHTLAPLPATTAQLVELASDPESDTADLVRVIELDPSLTLRILSVANSAISAARTRIKTVRNAVVRLGRGLVVTLALGSMFKSGHKFSIPHYRLSSGALWKHSVATAMAVEILSQKTHLKVPPAAYAAALLHDVGKLVLAQHLDESVFAEIVSLEKNEGFTRLDAEAEILGHDHAEIGGLIAAEWEVPDEIVSGIWFHHEPDKSANDIAYIVRMANVLAHLATDRPRRAPARAVVDSARIPLDLTFDEIDGLRHLVHRGRRQMVARYR